MRLFEKIKNVFSRPKPIRQGLFLISTKLEPFRLNAHSNNHVNLTVRLKNVSGQKKLVSVVVVCPKELGLTETLVRKREQQELGTLEPDEEKSVTFKIYASTSTPKKEFRIPVVAYSHYLDYEHVENAARKVITLRAV